MPPSTSSFLKLHFYINVMMRWKGHLFSLSWLETFLYQGFSHELCKFWKHIYIFCLDIIFVVLLRSIPLKPWRFQKNPNIVSIFVRFDVVQDFFGSDKDGIWLLNFNFNNFCVMIIVLFFWFIYSIVSTNLSRLNHFQGFGENITSYLSFQWQYMCA
jgi:hypothetical protein